jgi:transposase-like protein
VRIFPNTASCLRLVRALTAETHEEHGAEGPRALETTRYLNMDHLREHKKEAIRALEQAA